VCQVLSPQTPRTTPTPTHTAAVSPMFKKATAPGNGLGSLDSEVPGGGRSGSVTDPGAHSDTYLTTHANSCPLRGAWRARFQHPTGRERGVG
jgi:hypothetical protein